jgi:nucleoside phosphorylase
VTKRPRLGRSGPTLVVAAFAPELAPLRRALARRPAGARGGGVVCEPVGIGMVDAAAGAARAIARVAPRAILFVGTAGSYGRAPEIGAVVIARHLVLASTAAIRGDGYLPTPLAARAQAHPELGASLLRASSGGATGTAADVATTLAITRTAATARRLAHVTGASVENLEAFAVARAAVVAGVPFAAVLGIANRVGPEAHDEWRINQHRAAAAACAVVAAFLDGGAASVPASTSAKEPSRSRTRRRPRA